MILMSILEVDFGLFFWTLIIFLTFFFLLRTYAWKPILSAIRTREDEIEASLAEAEKAKNQMAQIKSDNEALLKEARAEHDRIINKANEMYEKIVNEAKSKEAEVQAKEVEKARQQIAGEKEKAIADIREMAASMSINIAEAILRQELAEKSAQEKLAKKLINEMDENRASAIANGAK